MDKKDSPPFEIIIGIGLVVVAAAVFLVASLARTAGSATPTLTPPPTPMPALSEVEGPTTAPTALPTQTVVPALSSPIPVTEAPLPIVAVPEIAPDFALPLAGGGTFTLTEQLAQGSLVLVFFQRGG